jgi:hypothetical protein
MMPYVLIVFFYFDLFIVIFMLFIMLYVFTFMAGGVLYFFEINLINTWICLNNSLNYIIFSI